jgi:hypothetical protein
MTYKKNIVLSLAAACVFSTASFALNTPITANTTIKPDTTTINRNSNDTTTKAIGATVIKGRVEPVNAAVEVWAISGSDSLKVGINDGAFIINGKPGIYKLVVVAKVPYKDVIKDDVQVADGNTTDLGTIRLQQ